MEALVGKHTLVTGALVESAIPDDISNNDSSSYEIFHFEKIQDSLQKMIKPGNSSNRACIIDLVQDTALNYVEVNVLKWDENAKRWNVQIAGKKRKVSIKTQNLLPIIDRQTSMQLEEFIVQSEKAMNKRMMGCKLDKNERCIILRDSSKTCPLIILQFGLFYDDELSISPDSCSPHHHQIASFVGQLRQPLPQSGSYSNLIVKMKAFLDQVNRNQSNDVTADEEGGPSTAEDGAIVKWFLLYALMDSKEWTGALESLSDIFFDIVSGRWPLFFLTEVLFMKALVAFELENREECQKALIIYDNYAHDYDRNRCDATMLKLWISNPGASSEDFTEAYDSRTRFDSIFQGPTRCLGGSYVCSRVANILGIVHHPQQALLELYEEVMLDDDPDSLVPSTRDTKDILDQTDYKLSLVTYRFRNEPTRVPSSTREEQDAEWVSMFGPMLFDPDNPDYMGDWARKHGHETNLPEILENARKWQDENTSDY